MAIQDIFDALEREAEERAAAIRAEAEASAADIEAEARRQADEIVNGKLSRTAGPLHARTTRLVNGASLENNRGLASARDAAVERVFTEAESRLGGVRAEPGYEDLFKGLAKEALEGVDGMVVLHVHPADAVLARQVLEASGRDGSVSTDVDTIGGLVVDTDGGRIVRTNTIESRLAKVKWLGRATIARALMS